MAFRKPFIIDTLKTHIRTTLASFTNWWLFHHSFYHTKYKRIQAPHVVGHYAAGARVIGLTENQLRKHMESLKARHAAGDNKSPYAEPLHIVFGKVGEQFQTKQLKIDTRLDNYKKRNQPSEPNRTPSKCMHLTGGMRTKTSATKARLVFVKIGWESWCGYYYWFTPMVERNAV